jgi:hypothetical protein
MSVDTPIGKIGKRSAWDNKTATRRLHGIDYQVFEDPDDIHDLINTEVRRELETDLKGEGKDPGQDSTINSLCHRHWKLNVVNIHDVQLNPQVVNSCDPQTGRKFTERLTERRAGLQEAIERRKAVIWPIVLLHEGQLLVDGYCRHSTLKEMGVPAAYSYIGRVIST